MRDEINAMIIFIVLAIAATILGLGLSFLKDRHMIENGFVWEPAKRGRWVKVEQEQ